MASSKVEICNMALSSIGSKQITLLDNSSVEGRHCLARYATTLESILEVFEWSFAKKIKKLAETLPKPDGFYSARFELPSDCVKPLRPAQEVAYEVIGREIYANTGAITLLYITKEAPVNLYTPEFAEAFSLKLARNICMALTGSESMRKQVSDDFVAALSLAMDNDAGIDNQIDETSYYADVRS
jgi:hypothetical protein